MNYKNKDEKEILLNIDYVVLSMVLKDFIIAIKNAPKDILDTAKDLPCRDFITIGVLVDKINLKNETKIKTLKRIPDCWIYVQDDSVKPGKIQFYNNRSPYLVKITKIQCG